MTTSEAELGYVVTVWDQLDAFICALFGIGLGTLMGFARHWIGNIEHNIYENADISRDQGTRATPPLKE